MKSSCVFNSCFTYLAELSRVLNLSFVWISKGSGCGTVRNYHIFSRLDLIHIDFCASTGLRTGDGLFISLYTGLYIGDSLFSSLYTGLYIGDGLLTSLYTSLRMLHKLFPTFPTVSIEADGEAKIVAVILHFAADSVAGILDPL